MSVRIKRWTREEYDRLVAAGGFGPKARVQLIDGEIVEMTPQSPPTRRPYSESSGR